MATFSASENCHSKTLFQYIKYGLLEGLSLNYVSIFEGDGGHKMLADAYVGEGGVSELLT